jgi:hypothetical protein
VSRQRIKHKTHSVGHLRVPVYPYGTPNGSERGPGWHAESDRRAQTTSRGDPRSPRAAHHHDRTRAHVQIGAGGATVRPRQRAPRPTDGHCAMRRVPCAPQRTDERAPLGELGGGSNAPSARRPAVLLPGIPAERLRRSYPDGAPEGDAKIRSRTDRRTVGE